MGENAKKTSMSANNPVTATDSIAVEWRIENLKRKLQDAQNRTLTSEPVSHASYPGITWQFQLNPRNRTEPSSPTVGVYLHANIQVTNVHARQCRTAATAIKAMFKLRFRKTANSSLICSSLRQSDMRTFGYTATGWGFADFAKHSVVEPLCADDGSIFLVGEILIQKDRCQHTEFSRQMFASGKHSDFQVIVGNETLQLHKWIFANASPALAELVEKRKRYKDAEAGTTPEAMLTLIQYLYGYQLWFKNLSILACDVLALAEKLQVGNGLKELCTSGLHETMTLQNVTQQYATAVGQIYEPLRASALQFIYGHVAEVFASAEWKALKEAKADDAVTICERLFTRMSEKPKPEALDYIPQAKKKKVTPNTASDATPSADLDKCERIGVHWRIPDFKHLMQHCEIMEYKTSDPFTHESLPGLILQLVVYPNGKSVSANNRVGVYLRHVTISSKKSAATAACSGFSLAFASPTNEKKTLTEQTLPVRSFRCGEENERGRATFAGHDDVERLCAPNGSILLLGEILIEPASSRQVAHSRRLLETGENSDFKVNFGNETFSAHKFVLSTSPVIAGMFGLNCAEMDRQQLTIREDTTVEAVKAMLQFWYGDPLSFDGLPELAVEVLKLAEEYQDWELVKMCETALLQMIKPANALVLAALAFRHKAPTLAEATIDFLVQNHGSTLRDHHAEAWIKLKESNLKLALEIAEATLVRETTFQPK